MNDKVSERIVEILLAGGGEKVKDETYVPLVVLESGTKYGLNDKGEWMVQFAGKGDLERFGPGTEPKFCEAVEQKRDEFEQILADKAKALGLDPDAIVLSFPSVEIVRDLLHRGSILFTRLALLFLIPSELRELRPDIRAVSANRGMPRPIRDLADHLTVPE
jgi:hypothetical protein